MEVVLMLSRQVIVDDRVDLLDIDTTSQQVIVDDKGERAGH
jgi:hypothetical protein